MNTQPVKYLRVGLAIVLIAFLLFMGPVILILFCAAIAIALFIFSRFFLAKPIKETWRGFFLAGVAAGAIGLALSYGLWKVISHYLPSKSSTPAQTSINPIDTNRM